MFMFRESRALSPPVVGVLLRRFFIYIIGQAKGPHVFRRPTRRVLSSTSLFGGGRRVIENRRLMVFCLFRFLDHPLPVVDGVPLKIDVDVFFVLFCFLDQPPPVVDHQPPGTAKHRKKKLGVFTHSATIL
jgi:hypothetical protein